MHHKLANLHWLTILVASLIFCIAGKTIAADEGQKNVLTVGEAKYYSWRSRNNNASGNQIVIPITWSTTSISDNYSLEVSMRTAYIRSENRTPSQTGVVSGLGDTVLSLFGSYAMSPKVVPFVVTSFNLPTGKETLSGSQKNALMDIDLVEQVRHGEGLNMNIGGRVTYNFNETTSTTISASRNFRGGYIPDGDLNLKYEPGTQTTVFGQVDYHTDRVSGLFGLKYSEERTSRFGGSDFFQPGDVYEGYASLSVAINERDLLSGFLSFAKFSKNESFDPFQQAFVEEKAVGAGNVTSFRGTWQRAYRWGRFGLNGSLLRRDENDFDAVNDQFIPARLKLTIGPEAVVTLPGGLSAILNAGYFRLKEESTVFTGQDQKFDGVEVSIGLRKEMDL
uniref:Uncharacterized protein n=1 Tax=Candidatus Kentrum sp. UNK TaxID=2126344 RepID=A0A451A9Z9_9GAMM|nr:MAG: hypothetical protein BECKUNK1418G_GA0071005_102732 [Candidatus Kentron sp. UNK]VFK70617.1 MAG: hypothetical protein BECKUNK1418H_GA0071006_10344 [Candidatus Kentron sp. UNK]